ncbi:type 1 glutamine amidotransferase [Methanolobus sp.]|uniref:type 1 glutamine amidotransferase n=1 Tax=Methanolobus sp. TaxID=1874737 RepID=UPI0025F876F7|nr:type 1 glutamine amidotransferase [Methanolobus sp.]
METAMRIHCLQHLEFETLGNIPGWVQSKGHILSRSLPYIEAEFPHSDSFDLLIIMGGLMSVYQENEYPWLQKEKGFVRGAIEAGKAVLGICFGAQMISGVLGCSVHRNDLREIGWHKVELTSVPRSEPFQQGLPSSFIAFQWHGDTYGLPAGARRLFTSEACKEQGFVYKDNVLAVQFHPEVNERCISDLMTNCEADLKDGGPYVQGEAGIRNQPELVESSAGIMFSILDRFEELHRNTAARVKRGLV